MTPFPHVRVEGSPLERGRQYGEQTRDRIERSIEAYAGVFERYAGWDWSKVRSEAARFECPIAHFEPKFVDEIRGIAEGAGVDTEDVLALNVRTEIMFAAKAREAAGVRSLPTECSSLAALPEATADRHTLAGQNWDWLVSSFDTVVVLEARQDDGPDFVTVAEAGMLAKTGMNSAGVGLVTNALVTDDDVGEPGVPFHVCLRAVLEAGSISDALAALQRRPRSSSANYTIVQDDGLGVAVEAMPGDHARLRLLQPEDGLVFHTNHYVSPAFDRTDVTLWLAPDSPFRLQRLRSLVSAERPNVTVDTIRGAFTDHVNHPHGICFHPDPRLPEVDREASVTSVIMDVTARKMWVSDGIPCETGYRELDYGDFLGGSPRSAYGSAGLAPA